MKIGIFIRSYGEKEPSGMSRLIDLTSSMISGSPENHFIIYMKGRVKNPPVFPGKNWEIEYLKFGLMWQNLGLFFSKKSDVYLFFTPVMPFLFKPKRSIVMVHDFAYKYIKSKNLKEKISKTALSFVNKFSFKHCTKIIAISNYSKNETKKFFSVPDKKIEVIYDGFTNICNIGEKNIGINPPFFIFAGALKERKNVANILKAFDVFQKQDAKNHKLLIAGKKSGEYYNKLVEIAKINGIEKKVLFLGYIKDEELVFLYKRATALVFPSLIEGFGMPVLEAMACGLPVITSNKGSLVEVAGDAAILVDPENINEIASAMKQMSGDDIFREELIKKGIKRAKEFSWDKTAGRIIKLANSLS